MQHPVKYWHSAIRFLNGSEPYMTIAGGDRRIAGVTVAEVNLKFVWDAVPKIDVGVTGHAYVVDGEGQLIAHPDISLVLRETNVSQLPQVIAALSMGSRPNLGRRRSRRPQGSDCECADPGLGWFVFVDLPTAEAFQPIYRSIYRTAGLILDGFLLAALAGLFSRDE